MQIVIDLVVGALAADHEDMSRMFTEVQDVPGVDLVVYEAGPMLFLLGLDLLPVAGLLLLVGLAPLVRRSVPAAPSP